MKPFLDDGLIPGESGTLPALQQETKELNPCWWRSSVELLWRWHTHDTELSRGESGTEGVVGHMSHFSQ
jgi:hypothetical protein